MKFQPINHSYIDQESDIRYKVRYLIRSVN